MPGCVHSVGTQRDSCNAPKVVKPSGTGGASPVKSATDEPMKTTPARRKPRILRVWIEQRHDPDADTSHMGQYAATPANRFAIDRYEQGDMERNEFRYFNPSFNYVDKQGQPCDGLTAAPVKKYVQEDYRRMERLDAGDWCYVGIIAKAEVQLTGDLCQVLRSGGLWGVESDSGDKYLAEVAQEELASLRAELEAVGFGKRAIAHAFTKVEHKPL